MGEQLAEVVIKETRPTREDGKGGIIAHGAGGFFGVFEHG